MNTIILHFNDKITEKLKEVLSKFSSEDLQVEDRTDAEFLQTRKELQKDYKEYKQNESELLSVNDAETEIDDLLSKL